VLYYLVVYAFANVGAFAVAAWLVRDKKTDDIEDLNGLGYQEPALATCILILMLSLIGIPPLAGFFAKLYVFMEALDQRNAARPVTLMWLVALGLFNSVVSAFYYVRVLQAMFFQPPGPRRLAPASGPIAYPIWVGTFIIVVFGIAPDWLMGTMQAAAVPMLTAAVEVKPVQASSGRGAVSTPAPAANIQYTPEQIRALQSSMTRSQGSLATPKKVGGPGAPPAAKAKTAPAPGGQPAAGKSRGATPAKGGGPHL
jgi:formate hydrogenlyase subunit 3/multisubunit Na+/H+ antiporter MnhD subunit